MNKFFLKGSFAAFTMALLLGCSGCKMFDFLKKGSDKKVEGKEENKVLCQINGNPVITEHDLISNLTQMLQANPYFRGAGVDALPMAIKRKFFDEMTKQKLIIAEATAQNITKDAEFIKAYKEMKKLIKESLIVQFYEKKIFDEIKIDEADVKKNFEENKDRYIKVAGGVGVSGVKFDKANLADAFLAKAKSQIGKFEELAKSEKTGKFMDMGRVSKEAKPNGQGFDGVPAPIKEAVFAMSKLPGVEKVKVGGDFWVIKASDKQAPIYFEMNEIKTQIEGMLKNNKFRDALDGRLKELKGKYTVTVEESYFKDKAAVPAVENKAEDKEDEHEDAASTEAKANKPATAA